jgi:hypothetical protein
VISKIAAETEGATNEHEIVAAFAALVQQAIGAFLLTDAASFNGPSSIAGLAPSQWRARIDRCAASDAHATHCIHGGQRASRARLYHGTHDKL